MAYPFRQMTTQELKKLFRDDRNKRRFYKLDPEARPTNDRKAKSQEDICKN